MTAIDGNFVLSQVSPVLAVVQEDIEQRLPSLRFHLYFIKPM